MQKGCVVGIFIAPEAGAPMRSAKSVRALMGAGLEGDRYAKEAGSFSERRRQVIRHVTLVSHELVFQANGELAGATYLFDELRRNIVLSGIEDIKALVGRKFVIGGATLRGVEECTPCIRPARALEQDEKAFIQAFRDFRGGIRAEVVKGGIIAVWDPVFCNWDNE